MVIDTFFDLQRFADDILISGEDGFTWQGGHSFAGINSKADDSLVGSATDAAYYAAYLSAEGLSTAGDKGSIYLAGSDKDINGEDPYSFSVDDSKLEIALEGARDIVHVGAEGFDSVTSGKAVLTVAAGRRNALDQTINGKTVYVQSASGTTITVSADDTYTFGDVANDTIGLTNAQTAVFGSADSVDFRTFESDDSIKDVSFSGEATVIASLSDINIAVKEGVNVTVDKDVWTFDNKKDTIDVATITADATSGVTKVEGYTDTATVTVTKKGLDTPVEVNGTTWNEITGKVNTIDFDKEGTATVHNTGSVTVSGQALASATFDTVTSAGVVVNTATIEAAGVSNIDVLLGSESAGVGIIATESTDLAATISGDKSFGVTVKDATYIVSTTADKVAFDADEDALSVTVEAGKEYDVSFGDGLFTFANEVAANGSAEVNINDAAITITNNGKSKNNYHIGSDANKAGIDGVMFLKANDAVNVKGDKDGYTAYFDLPDADDNEIVTFSANGKTVSVKAADVIGVDVEADGAPTGTKAVKLSIDSKDALLVQGIDDSAVVTVSGDATYYFNDKKSGSKAKVVTDEDAYITISGGIVDYRDATTQEGVDADQDKWDEIATIGGTTINGGEEDSVATNRSRAYDTFYALDSDSSVISFESDDDEEPTDSEGGVIEIAGETELGSASHVTLTVGVGGGSAPLNIQSNENDVVVDVKIDLTESDSPSTVAIGTPGYVSASHEVHLSNRSGGYAYIGTGATGENKLFGGSGDDMLRHDGVKQATLVGGAGNDTIRGDKNDVVTGGAGADYFYDTAGYALDYNIEDGDIIIASRVKSFDEITGESVRGKGNKVGFGDGTQLLTLSNISANDAVHVKVALMDNDGNVLPETKDVVLANGNGTVNATAADGQGALIIANSARGNGNGVHTVIGSDGKDSIYVGSNDFVDGGKGNDYIVIDQGATNVTVSLGAGTGQDTISGWNFGFEDGKTVLDTNGLQVRARVYEDMLHISLQGASVSKDAIVFDDTTGYGSEHGQYKVLVGDKKYTAIRNSGDGTGGEGGTSKGYASVTSNDEVADFYVAERNGKVIFTEGVTKSFTGDNAIYLGSDNAKQAYFAIRELDLGNNSKAEVMGSSERETVTVGGAASVGANKEISLAGGNDVIVSAGDDSLKAGHKFYFGSGDGRDTIQSFSHYDGVDDDPDNQHTDTIVLEGYTGLKTAKTDDGARIEIGTTDTDRVVIYEEDGVSVDKMYRIQVGFDAEAKVAKIGDSDGGNNFTYDKKVSYYVGASGDAHDTLTIGNDSENVEVWLDGYKGSFYRGIDVVDASAETYTNISIAGSADNNTITAGGEGTTNFLWGGSGDNSLIGGEGIDYFLYYQNSNASIAGATSTTGNRDTIEGYAENTDFIYLADITLDDIDQEAMAANGEHAGIAEDGVRVDFKNGGSLTVNVESQDFVRFYMNDGAVYTAKRETGSWHRER